LHVLFTPAAWNTIRLAPKTNGGGTLNWFRDFAAQHGDIPPVRNVEAAPEPMRQELIDAIYYVANQTGGELNADRDLYFTIIQSLGYEAAGQPHAGRRQRIGRDVSRQETHWIRIYDLIVRLWPEFQRVGFHEIYREAVNRILAAHGIAWDLGEDGHLHRVLPDAAQAQIEVAFAELSRPEYAPALALFDAARDAYDARPRRDRDACINIFQALEATVQIRYAMLGRTLDDVLAVLRRRQDLNAQALDIVNALNVLRHRNFGHGMAEQFRLSGAEVDFTYLACIGATLFLTRTI
jgi:hypothetical protein